MKKVNVLCINADVQSTNLGCAALGLSFMTMLEEITEQCELDISVSIVSYGGCVELIDKERLHFDNFIPIEFKKIGFYKMFIKCVSSADIIIDFTGGDSFTDIYKDKRFFKETLLKWLSFKKGKTFIMGPQTIGPFLRKSNRYIAQKTLSKYDCIFTRDALSYDYCTKELHIKSILTCDMAFALSPSDKEFFSSNERLKNRIGINVSGLLWNEDYNNKSRFQLLMDYRDFINLLITRCIENDWEVHLIGHVTSKRTQSVDNDYPCITEIKKKYPQTVIAPKFDDPRDAKKYMSCLDFFVGSRMHATVGAFSMLVPTIPVAYSRKFEGVFGTINYSHIIDAQKTNTQEAVHIVLDAMNNREALLREVKASMRLAKTKNNEFRNCIAKILIDI